MNTLVSIIVAIYNIENYLGACIDSILAQTYTDIEIILVDDGSTDKSSAICDEYAKKDTRITVIHKKNGGLSSARNAGLDEANGEYVSFIDGDDSIHKTFIEILLRMCEENQCDISMCDYLKTKSDSILLEPQKSKAFAVLDKKRLMDNCAGIGGEYEKYAVVWNKLYKRSLYNNIRFPEGKLHEDIYVTYRIYWLANKLCVTNLYLYYYLQRTDSLMGKRYDVARLDSLEAHKLKKDFFKEQGLDDAYKSTLIIYYNDLWVHFELVKKYIDNAKNILDKISAEAESVKQEILSLPGLSKLELLRIVYKHLTPSESEHYTSIYGDRIMHGNGTDYLFPYNQIPRYAKIALYGAGRMGMAYARQIQDTKYCEISIWVDNYLAVIPRMEYGVETIDALLRYPYDYVLVAIINPRVAQEIKNNLISWGIPEEKIILKDVYNVPQIERKDPLKQRFFLMNTPDHGNLGDHALAIATVEYLRDFFPEHEIIEITGRQWDWSKEQVKKEISSKDVIFIIGGGFMGDLWQLEDNRVKDIMAAFCDSRIIFLPQTFYYNPFASNLQNDREIYQKYKSVLAIHRERNSFNFFKKNVLADETRNKLYPDMALYLKETMQYSERDGILLCFRLDKEKTEDVIMEKIYKICVNKGVTIDALDTFVDLEMTSQNREDEVLKLFDKIRNHRLMITDRLHGMLFATITGTPCIALDNVSKKVSGVFQWIQNLPYVTCVTGEEVDAELIDQFYMQTDCIYDRSLFLPYYTSMAQDIYKWIEER